MNATLKMNLSPSQRNHVCEILDGRECSEGTILWDGGIRDEDALVMLIKCVRHNYAVDRKLAELVAEEASHYGDIRECRILKAAAKRIYEAIGVAIGLIKPPAPPRPKRLVAKPILEPTKPKPAGEFKLRSPEGVNGWCGPTAIAALMQVTTDKVAQKAKLIRGRKVIRGMYMDEAIGAIKLLGGHCTSFGSPILPRKERLTLKQWHAKHVANLMFSPRILVETTGHFVAIHGDDVLCSLQKGRAVRHIAYAAAGRMKVLRAWIIEDQQPKLLDIGGFRL